MSSRPVARGGRGLLDEGPRPGVTRFDVICGPRVAETVLDLLHGWTQARALPRGPQRRLASLLRCAVEHGLRFAPRALTVHVRWTGPDQVRLDVHWHGAAEAARPDDDAGDLEATVATLDALATAWGLGRTRTGWLQWMVADLDGSTDARR